VVRELNRYFMRGLAELLTPGSYRRREDRVGDYDPPHHGDVPGLMRAFALWLHEGDETHPILKAGIGTFTW
jgi:Fic family protein